MPMPEGDTNSFAAVTELPVVGKVKKSMSSRTSGLSLSVARLGSSQVPMLYMAACPEVNWFCASEYPWAEKPSWKHLALPRSAIHFTVFWPAASEKDASPFFSFWTKSGPASRNGWYAM